MKTFRLLALVAVFPAVLYAQTATSDDTTASGSKVSAGAPPDIPIEAGPKTSPENPTSGALVPSPGKGTSVTPGTPVDGGTGAGSTTRPTAPGTGTSTEGTGTGR